jgi:hypothetical protein
MFGPSLSSRTATLLVTFFNIWCMLTGLTGHPDAAVLLVLASSPIFWTGLKWLPPLVSFGLYVSDAGYFNPLLAYTFEVTVLYAWFGVLYRYSSTDVVQDTIQAVCGTYQRVSVSRRTSHFAPLSFLGSLAQQVPRSVSAVPTLTLLCTLLSGHMLWFARTASVLQLFLLTEERKCVVANAYTRAATMFTAFQAGLFLVTIWWPTAYHAVYNPGNLLLP